MGKYKTTKKEMNSNYDTIIGMGACNLQHLLSCIEAFAYSTRAEGWACDYYDIDGILISTGYSPLNKKRSHSNYNLESEYEDKARDIINTCAWDERKEKLYPLLLEYIEKATTK